MVQSPRILTSEVKILEEIKMTAAAAAAAVAGAVAAAVAAAVAR